MRVGFLQEPWAYRNGVKIDFSRPGKPTDDAFVESFNGAFRAEFLDTNWLGFEHFHIDGDCKGVHSTS